MFFRGATNDQFFSISGLDTCTPKWMLSRNILIAATEHINPCKLWITVLVAILVQSYMTLERFVQHGKKFFDLKLNSYGLE